MVPRLLMNGYTRQQIVIGFRPPRLDPEAANVLIARVESDLRRFYASPESRRQLLSEARRQMWGGLLTLILGLLGIAASPPLGPRLRLPFFFGVIGLGLVLFTRGYQRFTSSTGGPPPL